MITTRYFHDKGRSYDERLFDELTQLRDLTNRLRYYITNVSADHLAALELLRKAGIETKMTPDDLDTYGCPLELLADIIVLDWYLEGEQGAAGIRLRQQSKA